MADVHVESRPCHRQGTIVHVALDGVRMGHIVIADRVKEGSAEAIAAAESLGRGADRRAQPGMKARLPRVWPRNWAWMKCTRNCSPGIRWSRWSA